MIYIHKILPIIASPIFGIMFLMFVGIWYRFTLVIGIVALWLASTPIVSNTMLSMLESGMVRNTPASVQNAEAIVVLGGMTWTVRGPNGTFVTEWADPDRFFGSIELFKAGKAPKVVYTRGKLPWESKSIPEGEIIREKAIEFGIPETAILLTEEVANTAAEAAATKKLFPSTDRPNIILVTSAFHMPRAKIIFENAGFDVQIFPVDHKYRVQDTTILSFLPDSWALNRTSIVIREWIGQIYYSLRYAIGI